MLNKPKILTINTQFGSEDAKRLGLYGGVGKYRQRMVAKHLPEFTFNHVGATLLHTPSEDLEKTISEMVQTHDLVYTKQLDNPRAIYMLLGACDFYNKPLLIDFDDRVFATDGLSPDRYVYPKGSDIEHYLKTFMEEATALTVSTQPLATLYDELNTVHLLPNAVDMMDWMWAKRSHKRPTVGWAGSASHAKDHPILEEVYSGVITKHPDVVFSFVGHMLPEHIKGMKRKNWEIKPAISWWEGNPENDMTYPRLLAESGYDVGLAPLIPSQFNEARSLAKWFEYTMTGIPTVASKFGPYLALEDGKDAYLVESTSEWIDKINYLLENKNDIVTNARRRIVDEFSIERTKDSWRQVFSRYIGYGFGGPL